MATRVVVGYDGTEEAREAVVFAARSLDAERALIVHVLSERAATDGSRGLSLRRQLAIERGAHEVAAEGVALAEAIGLGAVPIVRRGMGPDRVDRVLRDVAESFGAEMVVVGHAARGRVSVTAM